MDEAKKLIINIVTWNSMPYIPGLLASLREQDTDDFTVTMVDNASTDGTVAWLQANRPDVTALRNFRNQGFSRAHNQAIALALSRWDEVGLEGRYIMVANPDLEFAPNALRLLIAFMDANPDVAACGPKLLRVHLTAGGDEEHREAERTNVIDSTGLVIRKSRRVLDRGAGETDEGQYDAAVNVFGISGACVVIRASALMDAKLAGEFFDEDMFAYQEDVDLAWRLRRLGHVARFVPQAVVWHHRRVPSAPRAGWLSAFFARRGKSSAVNFLSTRNHGWVLTKNDDLINGLLHLPWWLPYEAAKCVASLTSWSAMKGEVASFLGMPKMMKKRAELAKRAKGTSAMMRRWFV